MLPILFASVSYDTFLTSMEVERLLEVEAGSYEGDTWALLRDGDGQYGFLTFGWGSCPGCDAAEACSTIEEAAALRDELWNSIHWEPNAKAMHLWLQLRDWGTQYGWYVSEFNTFLAKALELTQTAAVGQ